MKRPVWEFARAVAAQEAVKSGLSTYQLTLSGLAQPIALNLVFNGLAAVCFWLLGHPVTAVVAFALYGGVDVFNQYFVRRWLAEAEAVGPEADADAGFRKLAPLCALRIAVYVAPTVAVALSGRPGDLLLFIAQACTLVAVGHSAGILSRRIFWGFISPILVAAVIVTVTLLSPLPAAAVLISLAALATLQAMMIEGTTRTVGVLHDAFKANVAMIPELENARDQAVAERTAADEAREAARETSRAKANFLATMSHEIRTPMNGVLGMAQLLQRDETNPGQKERLAVLIDSGEYLLAILNDILDVSKIEAGRLDIVTAAEDLGLFLDRVVSFWAPRADEKGVALTLDLDASGPAFVAFDALRLRQVLFNLVGNALKFTDRGTVSVVAKASPAGDGAVLLRLTVSDTGSGIAPEHLPQLFTRFSQGDETEVRRSSGTGLGLAIAKQLVELMGGKIWVESEPGQGSAFHIELPLALADGPALPKPKVSAIKKAAPFAKLEILAIDDNAINLMVLDQLLASFGHQITKASSGLEALAMMAERRFDLVLLDIQMPGMNGVEVLRAVRALEGPNRNAPIVALTADVTSGGRRRYMAMGFTEHSPKPIEIQALMDSIARAMAAPVSARQTVEAA